MIDIRRFKYKILSKSFLYWFTLSIELLCILFLIIGIFHNFPPEWLSGQPFSPIKELIEIIKNVCIFYGAYYLVITQIISRAFKREFEFLFGLKCHIFILSALSIVYLNVIQPVKTQGRTGDSLYDSFLELSVLNPASGTAISSDPYKLEVSIKNKTSNNLIIGWIKILNDNVSGKRLGARNGTTTLYTKMITIPPFQAVITTLTVSEEKSDWASIIINHNLSDQPSLFRVNIKSRNSRLSKSKNMKDEMYMNGISALYAFNTAVTEAAKWEKDACLIALFPDGPENQLRYDPITGIKIQIVNTWGATLYSKNENKSLRLWINENGVSDRFPSDDSYDVYNKEPSVPKIDNLKAIQIASSAGIIAGDWNYYALRFGNLSDKPVWFWALPYINESGDQILIDAISGEILVMSKNGDFENPILEPYYDHLKPATLQSSSRWR